MTRFAVNQASGAGRSTGMSSRVPRIGELLVAARIVKPEVLTEVLQIAKTSKTLIGRTLISVGQLDEHKLQAALDIQNLIRKQLVGTKFGVSALGVACASRISANDALKQLGWRPNQDESESHETSFGQLMLNAGLVSAQILALAEQQSLENNLPLGRCLVVNRYVTQNRLEAVLSAQVLIRDKQLTEDQALKALKISLENKEPLEHSLIQFGIKQLGESDKRILEILFLAGYISETGKLMALETCLTEDRSCNDILIESEMVTPDLLEKALTLQVQILTGNLTIKKAANFLKKSQLEGIDLQVLIDDLNNRSTLSSQIEQLLDLLKNIGILENENVTAAKKLAKSTGQSVGDILLAQKEINPTHVEAAWQAQRMIDDKMISFEYACSALRKLSGNTKQSQSNLPTALELMPSSDPTTSPDYSESWLSKIKRQFFKKK